MGTKSLLHITYSSGRISRSEAIFTSVLEAWLEQSLFCPLQILWKVNGAFGLWCTALTCRSLVTLVECILDCAFKSTNRWPGHIRQDEGSVALETTATGTAPAPRQKAPPWLCKAQARDGRANIQERTPLLPSQERPRRVYLLSFQSPEVA